jgi:hypothetical protein
MWGKMIACLLGAMTVSGAVWAQIPDDQPGISFDKLKQRSSEGSSMEMGLELFVVDKKLSGSKMTTSCESRYDDGNGLILYALKGGATSGKGTCGGDSFEWTAQSSVSGSRMVVSGKGTARLRNGDSVEVTQQFTVVVANGKCKLEAYNERVVNRSRLPSLKNDIVLTYETVMDAATTCFVG